MGWCGLLTFFEGNSQAIAVNFPHYNNIQAKIDNLIVNTLKSGWTNSKIASDLRRRDALVNERNESDNDAWGNTRSFSTSLHGNSQADPIYFVQICLNSHIHVPCICTVADSSNQTSLTFDDKTPVASDQMQRPDVYLQVQGLVLWTCHRYVFHISLSVLTVNEVHTPLQTEWVQVYIDITSILNVLYGIPRYLLVP